MVLMGSTEVSSQQLIIKFVKFATKLATEGRETRWVHTKHAATF